MAWNKEHKLQSRQRILTVAGHLFAVRGFEKTGIDDVMAAAGMTRGAFYHHFRSKSDLYAQSMQEAATARMRSALTQTDNPCALLDMQKLVDSYLSLAHVEGDTGGCPLAFLVSDISQRDDRVRETYTRLLQGMIDRIAAVSDCDYPQVLQRVILLIGGVAVARAINDPELQTALLEACRQGIAEETITEEKDRLAELGVAPRTGEN